MSDIEKAISYLKGLNHAPIVEYYNGYIVLAQDNIDLKGKKSKINQGRTDGFYTVDRVLNIGSNVEK